MKKKQIFFLKAGDDGAVAFRSWNDTYMRATDVGTVDCKGEEGDEETMFLIEPNADGTWALKSKKYGKYLFGTGEALTCFQDCTKIDPATKKREEPQPWTVHLAMHPQVALKHAKNKYASKKKTLHAFFSPPQIIYLRHLCYLFFFFVVIFPSFLLCWPHVF